MPNVAPSQYLGSFIGAYLTFTTFYLLEVIKKKTEPKPKLEISFNKEDEKELIVCSDPHYIFVPTTQKNIKFGKANYLRVKVTNIGDKLAHGCSGYLKTIKVKKSDSSRPEKLIKSEGSMRLLWAYEQKGDYRSTRTEQIPSGASEYLDILVSYDNALKPEHLDESDKEVWFLKLKTQPQPLKYADFLRVSKNSYIEYELTIEVYADECDPSSICLTLKHEKNTNCILISSSKSPKNSPITFTLCDPPLSEENIENIKKNIRKNLGEDITFQTLYDLL